MTVQRLFLRVITLSFVLIALACAYLMSIVGCHGAEVAHPFALADHATIDRTAFRLYITRWEGCTFTPVYHRAPHTHGETTVGIGHNVAFGMDEVGGYAPHRRYSSRDITVLFDQDYAKAIGACRVQIAGFDALPQPARFVCLSLVWTCGPTGFAKWDAFHSCIERHLYSLAAASLNTSLWARQVSSDRLIDHWNALDGLRR